MTNSIYKILSVHPVTTPAVAVFKQDDGNFLQEVCMWAMTEETTAHGNVYISVEGLVRSRYGEKHDPWHFEIAPSAENFEGYQDGTTFSSRTGHV